MTVICHLALPGEWELAQGTGALEATVPTEGFVHCSTPSQLVDTIDRHFSTTEELRVLVLDPSSFGDMLRWEEGRPGEVYPHIYRPIALDEVRQVVTWQRGADGSVELPAELAALS